MLNWGQYTDLEQSFTDFYDTCKTEDKALRLRTIHWDWGYDSEDMTLRTIHWDWGHDTEDSTLRLRTWHWDWGHGTEKNTLRLRTWHWDWEWSQYTEIEDNILRLRTTYWPGVAPFSWPDCWPSLGQPVASSHTPHNAPCPPPTHNLIRISNKVKNQISSIIALYKA